MKKCFKCGLEKELTEFYKQKNMSQGVLGKCKTCTKNDSKNRRLKLLNDPNWIKTERDRHREKYHRLEYREKYKPDYLSKKEQSNRFKQKYPEKVRAKNGMGNIKSKLPGNNLHHWSYNKEHIRDVIELSIKDHNTAHRFMVYDQERMMYRRSDNNVLLDTKVAHEDYIFKCIENERRI